MSLMNAFAPPPLSLYLHIPFCDHRCAYCDFNAYAGLDHLMDGYVGAIVEEIGRWGPAFAGRRVPTVFFGGGTPSLLPLPLLERVVRALHHHFAIDHDAEWTLEANPGTVDAQYFRGLRALGFNRVSMGVQSFDDEQLRRLDRIHDGQTAVAAYQAARLGGFTNVSLDLIYGLEGQSVEGWWRNVERALTLGPEHLSLYALTIEEGTPLAHRVSRGDAPEPDGDTQADMYDLARDQLGNAGYDHYEISNWSLPGYACKHNLVYWRDGEWLGLGAGAHSHLGHQRFAVLNSPAGYIRALRHNGTTGITAPLLPVRAGCPPWLSMVEDQPPAQAMADAAVMALRLREGLDQTAFARRFGQSFSDTFPGALEELASLGLLECHDSRIRIPAHHRIIAGEVFARLLAAMPATSIAVV